MSKQFLAIIAVIILIFAGVFIASNHKSTTSTSDNTPTNHVEGLGKSGVTLTEYGDYQCPYCGEYYPVVKQVVQQYYDQIYFQFRNFPLTSIHQNAFAGARAAEAAGLQGAYWQMHDQLYSENQEYYDSNETASTWINAQDPLNDFDQYALDLKLNVSKFNSDYSSDKVNNLINSDMAVGNKLGIDATPTFFINGKQVSVNQISVAAFQKLINQAIAEKAVSH